MIVISFHTGKTPFYYILKSYIYQRRNADENREYPYPLNVMFIDLGYNIKNKPGSAMFIVMGCNIKNLLMEIKSQLLDKRK